MLLLKRQTPRLLRQSHQVSCQLQRSGGGGGLSGAYLMNDKDGDAALTRRLVPARGKREEIDAESYPESLMSYFLRSMTMESPCQRNGPMAKEKF